MTKGRALVNLKKTLPAVLTGLSWEASEQKDADAYGLHDFMSRKKVYANFAFNVRYYP